MKFFSRIFFLALSLFFLFSTKTLGQSYDFISYGVEDGLSQSEARCVLQDSRGFLWIGTAGGGVCSFDGIKFHEYGKKDGLAGQIISTIAEDSTGKMWFGTVDGGASSFDGKSFILFDGKRGLEGNNIKCIVAKKESVWIGQASGIFEYTEKNNLLRRIATFSDLNLFCFDKNGTAWVGTGRGLFFIKNGIKDSLTIPFSGKDHTVSAIQTDNKGLIYIGTNEGIFIYDTESKIFLENDLIKNASGKQVTTIFIDHQRAIWVSTLNNLVLRFYPDGNLISYNKTNGLTAEGVYGITEDNTHHIWFSTREQSLVKLRSEAFSYYGNYPGMGSGTVFRILEDQTGRMWIGSNEDGLYRFDGKISKPVLNGGKPFKQPVAIIEDTKKKIWIGHFDGLTCMINDHPVKNLLQGIRVRSLLEDTKGNLWIGTWGKGLFKYDGIHLENFTTATGDLPGDYVHSFCEDLSGNIWIGTGNGLVKYDPENVRGKPFKTFGGESGICNPYIGSIIIDPSGVLWFHTDACVMRYDGVGFTSYTEEDGLASNTIYLLAPDSSGKIWVGTNKGIDRLEIDETGRVAKVKNYSRNEGFRGIECNSRAVFRSRDNCLWFGTVKGVIKYDPSKDFEENVIPIIHVTGISLFLEKTDWSYSGAKEVGWFHLPDKLELDFEHNHLTFLYQGIHLQSPQSTRYQFMLVGFDSTWQPVTSESQFTYTNLSAGTYVFKVKASNTDGKWNEAPAFSCPIIILPPPPPFWKTWWFVTISILLIGGVLYYVVVGRTQRILKQKLLLEAEVRDRTLEISRQNEEKTVMLKEIHHRVKNNLQVISSLLNLQADGISDKRVLSLFEDCRHRVNSMALIHEKMYQSNNLVNIDIRNYIDELIRSLIDAYDTNKMIHLHTEIEEHPFRIDTIVPLGLILNEIISNSLKYAFNEKKDGDLYVTLRKLEENKFVLEVSDNGKGIPEAIDFAKAESLGMQLIQMLSGQINGKVNVTLNGGTKYRIEFEEEVKDRF